MDGMFENKTWLCSVPQTRNFPVKRTGFAAFLLNAQRVCRSKFTAAGQ